MADMAFAHASIDWAVSMLPSYAERMQAWLNTNVGVRIKQLDSDRANNMLVTFSKEPPPLSFSVEAGAYINAIRSSLDILAIALADRNGITNIKNIQFPIAKSESDFIAGKYNGANFVNRLPGPERQKIESLKPYQGGNPLLWQLHYLDIVRKHRRLVEIQTRPATLRAIGCDACDDLRRMPHVSPTELRHVNGETELGPVSKLARETDFQISAQIAIAEPGYLYGYNAIVAIGYFANLARDVIHSLK
jgi:hypothetical protein